MAASEEAKLKATPHRVLEGDLLVLRGSGWPDCPAKIAIRGKPANIQRILLGYPAADGVRPIAGEFAVSLVTYGLQHGRHDMTVAAPRLRKKVTIEVLERPRPSGDDEDSDANLSYWRGRAAFDRRFRHIGRVPAGVIEARASSLARSRKTDPERPRLPGGQVFFSAPVPGGSNWVPLGPAPFAAGQQALFSAVSGRVCSIAVDPTLSNRLYAGTANGGVWKSTDGGTSWSAKTDDQPSLAIGALAIDPNSPNRVFAGTGEYNHGDPYNAYYGHGLLYSDDYGETWTQLAAATFDRAEISRLLFDPNDTAHHMFLACESGVFESATGGTTWTLLRAGSASDLVLRPLVGPSLQLTAAFYGEGLFTSTLSGGVWSAWAQIASAAFPSTFGRIALGQSRNHPDNIWAAFSTDNGTLLAGIAKSADGGGAWTSVAAPSTGIWQTVYNLFIAIHPDVPNTVFLGTSTLFRTDTGDAPWAQVAGLTTYESGGSNLHADHHAFAFDPSNANTAYDGSDGGVFRSDDGGATWRHRNHGLGTLQIYQVANHPQWSALVLAGTQDNGGGFGTAAPAWLQDQWAATHNGIEGDIVAVAIEPLMPSRMYYVLYGEVFRSDDGGQLWSGKFSIPAPQEWNTPFIIDAAIAGVCYTGGNVLQRSQDAGDTWSAVTAPLGGNITTIAVHPANSDLLYLGTSRGHVYRVQRTGPDWTLANVTTTDLTAAPLPAEMYISCIAVESGGAVWVTFSSILQTEETGEFSNDHVYRLPAGSSVWQNRSAGLAQANPVNAIVVDPSDDSIAFCGADTGVFRWNAGAASWERWDQGLPNSPVLSLSVQNSARLIRAGTYGRGVWERSLAPGTQPMVDIYMRDNILDSGRGPAPSGVPHPFHPADLVWWWQSEDIKVDAQPFQTTSVVADDVALANLVTHRDPKRGAVNRFYVQVHNRGPLKATNPVVRAFFANASLGLPNLPADFWSTPKPFLADPGAADWTPIGPALHAGDIEPGHTVVVEWDWIVPASAAAHSCLLALATCDQDALSQPGQFVVADVVTNYNNVTLKNLHIVP